MVSACIFDLDGVIVDTAKYHYLAWKRLAQELGMDFSEVQNERLKGVSRMKSLNILLEEAGIATLSEVEKTALAEKKNRWYVEYISQLTPDAILHGVLDFIYELKQHHFKIALGSASKNAKMVLNKLQIAHLFDAVIDGAEVMYAKPDPEIFLLAARAMHVTPPDCVVFEDAEVGIEAAEQAGMVSVGVGNPGILKNAAFVISGFGVSEALDRVKIFLYKNR